MKIKCTNCAEYKTGGSLVAHVKEQVLDGQTEKEAILNYRANFVCDDCASDVRYTESQSSGSLAVYYDTLQAGLGLMSCLSSSTNLPKKL